MTSPLLQSTRKCATAPKTLSGKLLSSALLVALAGVSAPVLAFNDDPGSLLLKTSFASPGARAAGMGGAFIGLADDSSAAFLNPAGILLLPNNELTIEARYRKPDSDAVLSSIPSSALNERFADNDASISYLSYAYASESKKWGFGLFYGELSDYSAGGSWDGFRLLPTTDPNVTSVRPSVSALEVTDRYFGASVAFELSESLRVGGAVYRADRELESEYKTTDNLATFLAVSEADDSDTGFNFGAHWQITDDWSAGLSYRSSLEFDSTETLSLAGTTPTIVSSRGSYVIPSAFTMGLGLRASDKLTLALDVSRIGYSELAKDATSPPGPNFPRPGAGQFFGVADALRADDGTDIRVGLEYLIPREGAPVALRAGAWRESDARLYVPRNAVFDSSLPVPNAGRVLFPEGDSLNHVTLGAGFGSDKFYLDFALDRSSEQVEFVSSIVFYL